MKKVLLASALLGAVGSANAQLALENFNAAGLPAGWTMINADGKTISSALNTLIVAKLKTDAWMKWPSTSTTDSMMITTSLFTPAGTADRWLITPPFPVSDPNTMITWEDLAPFSPAGVADVLEIKKGDATAIAAGDFTTTLWSGAPSISTAMSKKGISLAAYNGTTIRIAFRCKGTNAGVVGVDNVQTELMVPKTDVSADLIQMDNIVLGSSSTPVQLVVTNKGTTTVTSIKASYSVDGGTAVSETFPVSLIYGTSATLNFSTKITGTSVAAHTVVGTIEEVNSAPDADPTNNTTNKSFSTASKSVSRSGLMEEFTSSTCAPCASFNSTFDPLILSIKANDPATKFNIIKYQMNWPAPGNDVSYNGDGSARRGYYGVSGIPDHYTNGGFGGNGDLSEINGSKTAPAFMDITGTYVVKGDSLISEVTVTPHFTGTGNYKLHMAATEYHYTNPGATTTQKEYYHVMRTMLNAGAGTTVTSWTAGVAQNFRWATKYTKGTVAQLSNTFWGSPINGNLIVFVQDQSDKSVMQSQSVPATWPLSVPNVNSVISHTSVYPNPAIDRTSIVFKLESATNVSVNVVDATGRTVYSVPEQQLSSGNQTVEIPTAAFAAGVYLIKLNADGGSVTERFSVVK